jgi:formylmethanofuran dehydrogenase subunit C
VHWRFNNRESGEIAEINVLLGPRPATVSENLTMLVKSGHDYECRGKSGASGAIIVGGLSRHSIGSYMK